MAFEKKTTMDLLAFILQKDWADRKRTYIKKLEMGGALELTGQSAYLTGKFQVSQNKVGADWGMTAEVALWPPHMQTRMCAH